MKLAVVSTTIRGSSGYEEYVHQSKTSKFSEVFFIIAADVNSEPFDNNLGSTVEYLTVEDQKKYKCSEFIGWKKFARRNIALLRAIALNPDYILMVDDDNEPLENYFDSWHNILSNNAHTCITLASDEHKDAWHNYLRTADTKIKIYPRGFPISFRDINFNSYQKDCNLDINRVGLFQGISLGDPDIDAITRIVYSDPTPMGSVKEKNYCLKDIWSPYNTQNTLFSKILFPLAFTWPHADRYEDIYASLIWQRFLFNNNMYVHIGDSMNYQVRGKRNNLRDLSLEIEGYFNIKNIWEEINKINETNQFDMLTKVFNIENPIIKREKNFVEAWVQDIINIS